jgi:N-acetylglucosaminyldiphosphoundecaprenol N-acetyl-beta-D-mannosaminyltransferase
VILGSFIDALTWDDALDAIARWAVAREPRHVCICNVHVLVTAVDDPALAKAVEDADMATPDGMPVAWLMRRTGHPGQERINGPDLMWKLCGAAERQGLPVFFYGSTDATLDRLAAALGRAFPALRIAGAYSPPFRPLSAEEDEAAVRRINASGAAIVFVGLGCPKQEIWMAAHKGSIRAVMLGVGAAFDFHAGVAKRAPAWMREGGLEWLHRLASEPRRLWRRYLATNTRFLVYCLGLFLRSLLRRFAP